MNQKVKIVLVGYGYWGKNLLRNFISNNNCEVVGVVDNNKTNLEKVKLIYPHIPLHNSLKEFSDSCKADAAIIAVPPYHHKELAIDCINLGMDILVEKPLALNVADSMEILQLAKSKNRIVGVDHTFVYHPAVEYIKKEVIDKNQLGEFLQADSTRTNLGGFQPITNALWDLAPHDFSILDYLTNGKTPKVVSAIGVKHYHSGTENLSYVTMLYDDNFISHFHLNWVSPVKVRNFTVVGRERMVVFDDLNSSEKVKIYNHNLELKKSNLHKEDFQVNYRVGDVISPCFHLKEALAVMTEDFLNSVKLRREPLSNGEMGLRVVRLIQAADLSIKNKGRPVEIQN